MYIMHIKIVDTDITKQKNTEAGKRREQLFLILKLVTLYARLTRRVDVYTHYLVFPR